ncbi:MAG: hypothetical protein AAF198_02580 [Pseudomonadota bacterium]
MMSKRLHAQFAGMIATIAITAAAVFVLITVFWPQSGTTTPRGHTTQAWQLLASVEIYDTSDSLMPNVVKTFPDNLRAATNEFEIEGYLLRYLAEPYLQAFMLVPDPPECEFCGGGGYGPFLDVQMKTPMSDLPNYTKLRVRGTIELIEDPEIYEAVRLVDAVLVD